MKVPGCEIMDWSWVIMVLLYVLELIKVETGVVIMKRLSHNLWGRHLLSEEFGISWINCSLSESEHLYSQDLLWENIERWASKGSCWRLETLLLRDRFSVADLDQDFFISAPLCLHELIICCRGLSYTPQNIDEHSECLSTRCQRHLLPQRWQPKTSLDIVKHLLGDDSARG